MKESSLSLKELHPQQSMYKQDLLSKQIGLSKSHSKPSPYCKRIRGDTSHRYLDLTRKREKKKREEGSTDVEYCDISFGISFGGRDILKDSFSAKCHEV